MFRSSTTRSGFLSFSFCRRLAPPSQSVTSKPCMPRYSPTISRASASSSTTKMRGSAVMGWRSRSGRVGSRFQAQHERAAIATVVALDRNVAGMQIDDALGDRQTEPGRGLAARRFRRQPLEAAEHAIPVFRRKPGPTIADADNRLARFARHADDDIAAERAVFDGIADDIVERFAQAIRIAARHQALGNLDRHVLPLARGQRAIGFGDVADETGEVEILPAHGYVEHAARRI